VATSSPEPHYASSPSRFSPRDGRCPCARSRITAPTLDTAPPANRYSLLGEHFLARVAGPRLRQEMAAHNEQFITRADIERSTVKRDGVPLWSCVMRLPNSDKAITCNLTREEWHG